MTSPKSEEPFTLFKAWMAEAEASEPNDPNAMALATVDETGLPNVRMVLLKGFDENGFVFYTNTESNKGRELLGQRKAALVLHWKSLRRQVRARGPMTLVSEAEADAYFQSRPRDSRIGAWASQQSRPLESRFALEKAVALNTREIRHRRGAAPALLDGLPHRAGLHRVLAGQAVPPPRPRRLHPRGRGLAQGAALSVRLQRYAMDRCDATGLRVWPLTRETRCPPHPAIPAASCCSPAPAAGIGHATVKRFSAAGWRVITCSRHGFPENCPWEMGPEDHLQVDLAMPRTPCAPSPR